MNDELINILDEFMNFDFNSQGERIEINEYERNILKDYITNLQQENQDYKSRCEKIQEIINTEKKLMGYAIYDSCLLLIEETLNGRSDK